MKIPFVLSVATIALAASACSKKDAAVPTGQVVATVDGHEITAADLRAELGPVPAGIGAAERKQAEQNALQIIIFRYILADAAAEKKLDSTPEGAILKKRGEQMAMAELLQRNLKQTIPAPSREEAQIYVSDHPATFGQRRVTIVDQYVARNVPPDVVKAMEPMTTMEQISSLLDAKGIKYAKTTGAIDALAINPEAAQKLAALPVGSVFISPEGNIVRVNRIRESNMAPIAGDDAIKLATDALQAQRGGQMMQSQVGAIIQKGMANVKYNAAYKPAVQPGRPGQPGQPPAAPAPAK